jgi:hypothetical protein
MVDQKEMNEEQIPDLITGYLRLQDGDKGKAGPLITLSVSLPAG